MKSIDENAPDDVVRILVGNKSDLHHRLIISTQDGKRLADKYHVDFFETSAKSDTSTTISQMFDFLAEKLLDLKQPKSKQTTDTIDLNNNQSTSIYDKFAGCCSFTTTV
jgi:GTPase SAR1 family protein